MILANNVISLNFIAILLFLNKDVKNDIKQIEDNLLKQFSMLMLIKE